MIQRIGRPWRPESNPERSGKAGAVQSLDRKVISGGKARIAIIGVQT